VRRALDYVNFVGRIILGDLPQKNISELSHQTEFMNLPKEMQHYIIGLLITISSADNIDEATEAIRALTRVNHALHDLINEPKFCLKLIKSLAKKLDIADEEAAKKLQILEAQRRLKLQQEFLKSIYSLKNKTNEEVENTLNDFIKRGADVNFTYINNTILRDACEYLLVSAISFLINNGADVNATDTFGFDSLHLVLTDIDQYYQNNLEKKIELENAIKIIKILLDAGADPEKTYSYYTETTPLTIAKEIGNPEIIKLIQDAIDKKHEKK